MPTDGRSLYFVKVVLAIEEPLPAIGSIVGHNRPARLRKQQSRESSVEPTDDRSLYFVTVVLVIDEPLPTIKPIVARNRLDCGNSKAGNRQSGRLTDGLYVS